MSIVCGAIQISHSYAVEHSEQNGEMSGPVAPVRTPIEVELE